jgi:hypothetical protein
MIHLILLVQNSQPVHEEDVHQIVLEEEFCKELTCWGTHMHDWVALLPKRPHVDRSSYLSDTGTGVQYKKCKL